MGDADDVSAPLDQQATAGDRGEAESVRRCSDCGAPGEDVDDGTED